MLRAEAGSAVQLCGFTADGTLYARVNQSLFVVGPYGLPDMLLGRL